MPPRKKLSSSPEKGTMAAILAKMSNEFGIKAETAEDYSKSWRYMDFVDPFTGLPSIAHEALIQASGFRAGTVNQLRGQAATGKSSLCMLEYASACRNGGAYCAHVETEGAGMNNTRVASFGIDPNNLAIPRGVNSFEATVEFVDTLRCIVRGGDGGSINEMGRRSATKFKKEDAADPDCTKPIIIGIDSLSALGKEDNTRTDVADMSKTPQLSWLTVKIREWMRQKASVYERDQLTLFLTTHETQKIKIGPMAGFGPPEKTSVAGDAIKMFDTVAIDFSVKDWKDKAGEVVGTEMILRTFKNKLGRAGKKISFFLTKDNGFDMIHTDAEYLISSPFSPFAANAGIFGCEPPNRWGQKIRFPHFGKEFGSEEEFVRWFYENKEVLDQARDGMRIFGYGLPHESKYRSEYENGVYIGDGSKEDRDSIESPPPPADSPAYEPEA